MSVINDVASKIVGMMPANHPPEIAPELIMIVVWVVEQLVICFFKNHPIHFARNPGWFHRIQLRLLLRKATQGIYRSYCSDLFAAILQYGKIVTDQEMNLMKMEKGLT